MRGGFANPPPGTPLGVDLSRLGDESGGGDKLRKGIIVSNEDVLNPDGVEALARKNFRVGVVVPDMVERVDLGLDDRKSRRWVWWWVGEGVDAEGGVVEGWKGVETWP
jgi:pyridoxamine 5'-phosphate oxidase